jgi:hypothetical protein
VSRLQSRYVLRFLRDSRSPVRAVEVRLFNTNTLYDRTPVGSRRWEPIGDLAKTADDISKYICPEQSRGVGQAKKSPDTGGSTEPLGDRSTWHCKNEQAACRPRSPAKPD